jgi:hypothetical protein
MARIIIEGPQGQRFSVTTEAHERLYPDYAVIEEETDASFVAVGIPSPKKSRRAPKAKDAVRVGVEAPADGSMSATIEGDPNGESLPELMA